MDVSQASSEVQGCMCRIETYASKKAMTKVEERKLQTILDKVWALADAMQKKRIDLCLKTR